jgi:hypothetical protein
MDVLVVERPVWSPFTRLSIALETLVGEIEMTMLKEGGNLPSEGDINEVLV